MSDINALRRRAKAYAAARGLRLTYVSKLIFADWRRLDALATGNSYLRPPTLAAALKRMSELEARPAAKRTRTRKRATTSEAANARDA